MEVGDGQTIFGTQIKHNFGSNDAGNAQVLFGDNTTVIGVHYSYNKHIPESRGLSWHIGVGPQVSFIDYGKWHDDWYDGKTHTDFAIRPTLA